MMRKLFILTLALVASLPLRAFKSEIREITLSDGERIAARLSIPDSGAVCTIVVCVPGTGPNTYLNQRAGFNYFDVLADGFCRDGVALLTYNRRGVTLGERPPMIDSVTVDKYALYTPLNEASDVESIVSALRRDRSLRGCKIALYGISEGTIIASMVAERQRVVVDALMLHGYAHENLCDIIEWQNDGNGVMILINSIFDRDNSRSVSRAEYESEDPIVKAYRSYLFQNMAFDSTDVTRDGVVDISDIKQMRGPFTRMLNEKIRTGDDGWIWNNYFRVTSRWLKEHYALEANKTRLLRVGIPIFVFHGTDDASVPVEGVRDLERRFEVCNKSNLTVCILDKHNHDLNFQEWIATQKYSVGLQKVFDCAAGL